jgi:hypothetical protein
MTCRSIRPVPGRSIPGAVALLLPLLAALPLELSCARYSPDTETRITAKTARYNGPVEGIVKVLSEEQTRSALDYDVRKVCLVPVSVRIKNRGVLPLQLDYLRTRLTDGHLAYALVPTEVAILRTERTGFWKAQFWMRTLGLMGYMLHRKQINGANEHLREDFETKALPEKPLIPNATFRGVLFFQIDQGAAENYDPDRYSVVLSFVSPGDPPVIELRFDPDRAPSPPPEPPPVPEPRG